MSSSTHTVSKSSPLACETVPCEPPFPTSQVTSTGLKAEPMLPSTENTDVAAPGLSGMTALAPEAPTGW